MSDTFVLPPLLAASIGARDDEDSSGGTRGEGDVCSSFDSSRPVTFFPNLSYIRSLWGLGTDGRLTRTVGGTGNDGRDLGSFPGEDGTEGVSVPPESRQTLGEVKRGNPTFPYLPTPSRPGPSPRRSV